MTTEQATANNGGARHSYVQALIPLDKIEHKEQVRKDWTSAEALEALEGLTESVKEYGVLQPLLVAPIEGTDKYRLVAGHRRLASMEGAGEFAAPVLITHVADHEIPVLQLIENKQRHDLSPIDEGHAYIDLIEHHGWTMASLARRLGVHVKVISSHVRLVKDSRLVTAAEKGLITAFVAARLTEAEESYAQPLYQQLADGKRITLRDVEEAIYRQHRDGVAKPWSRYGIKRGRNKPEDEDAAREVYALYQQGIGHRDIALKLGIPIWTEQHFFNIGCTLMLGSPAAKEGGSADKPQGGIAYTVDARDSLVRLPAQDAPAPEPRPAPMPIYDPTAPPTDVVTREERPERTPNAARSPVPMRGAWSPQASPARIPSRDPLIERLRSIVGTDVMGDECYGKVYAAVRAGVDAGQAMPTFVHAIEAARRLTS